MATVVGPAYWFDEVYMLAIGRYHLDWGSADQPLMAPLLASAMDAIAPDSIFVLRLPAVLASAGAVVMAALIARELGGDGRAQTLTALAQATGVWVTVAGHWLTPYALEPVQWMVVVWLLIRWIRVGDDRLLVAMGVAVGIAALTKFQVLLLCAVLLATVLVFGPRSLLRRPLLWVGGCLAALIAAPTLLWQHRHGWPQLQMTTIVANEAEPLYGGRAGIAMQLILFAGVAGIVLIGYGIWRLFRDAQLRPYRFLGATFVVLFVVFVAAAGRPYYLCGLYAPLAAAGAIGLQRRRASPNQGRRWLLWPGAAASAVVAVAALAVSVTMTRSDVGQNIAERTAAAYHELPAPLQARAAVVGESYIVAAYLEGYAHRYRLPPAYSVNRSYGYFPPPDAGRDVALYVGRDDAPLRPFFAASRLTADIGDDFHVFVLTGRVESWQTIWERQRTLSVT
ncbi:glycosyltransferase family 39 protein [Mycolicibacterium sp. S2-37]|uniref:glycosyltransferase family 39 protein n=1 Tax=Mycolicibacterium sp. S2-37 TaxID=2810297 RepID=UPI0027DA0596|nr:glycosyltransferase family 39 protein [Mycolicibacterium sp. S2-37]